MLLRLKRVYEAPAPDDGVRVLVDRLWPRGVSKERAAVELWAKDVAPSPELREQWHAAERGHWVDFVGPYRAELAGPAADAVHDLACLFNERQDMTLVYAARDPAQNHATVLAMVIADVSERLRAAE
ncbi:DUF488 domain-containing protein [Microbacterium gorillae]|uniref:DUF488 domain-containing protein n=1 Tax=Microbacterium gorillae TaxID=1231063 RepID=UPI00058D4FE8|nr:DUF488 family protein [Microbacterium gorillae]